MQKKTGKQSTDIQKNWQLSIKIFVWSTTVEEENFYRIAVLRESRRSAPFLHHTLFLAVLKLDCRGPVQDW